IISCRLQKEAGLKQKTCAFFAEAATSVRLLKNLGKKKCGRIWNDGPRAHCARASAYALAEARALRGRPRRYLISTHVTPSPPVSAVPACHFFTYTLRDK